MATETDDSSCDALHALTEQIFSDMKITSPMFEDLLKAAGKYQAQLEQSNIAATQFVDTLARLATTASRARGGTAELGLQLQRVVARHRACIGERVEQTQKLIDQMILPLSRRLKVESKVVQKMEDDVKSMAKSLKSDLKKAESASTKIQHKARKSTTEDGFAIDQAIQAVSQKARIYESFHQRSLRAALIEERRRYCYLVDNYLSVFASLDLVRSQADQDMIADTLALVAQPDDLPPSSEAVIFENSSDIQEEEQHQSIAFVAPSPLTREIDALNRRRGTAVDTVLPPGCPPGGILEINPTEDQINPRRNFGSIHSSASGVPSSEHTRIAVRGTPGRASQSRP